MSRFKNISGLRFGRLIAVKVSHKEHRRYFWECQCDCGKLVVSDGNGLRMGKTKSCGCLMSQLTSERNLKHGKYGTPEYRSWGHMWSRCTNPKVERYPRYGGRGIHVCDRWKEFSNFLADMGQRPSRKHSINRINNDGNYEPSNCEWSVDQHSNTSRNVKLSLNGIERTISQWAKKTGIKAATIRARINNRWSVEAAITSPIRGSVC